MALLRREETSHDLYLTEKEFRAYGLRGERRNVSPRIVPPALEALHREYEREHLARQPNLIYGEAVPAHRENRLPAYTRGARHELPPATSATAVDAYARDPYYGYSYYGSSSLDPYLAPQRENHLIETDPVRRETDHVERLYSTHVVGGRRENHLIETDPVLRRETDCGERLYSIDAAPADAASSYNRTENYQATKADALPAPVSSPYAFACPSYSYR
ncbi:unnamed protein product [Prunus armeniaca]|uniref:DCD domain-containing protein n=1 Tax=Prunus armeniaca TaxID=36596 RepID=A0A6J5WG18_PRUAR|nr:unnamed protein product [Prunus armeniaca]CAB4300720.1 unnamed protein product [Prunus armeniaca]